MSCEAALALPIRNLHPRRFARLFTNNIPDTDDPIWELETRALLARLKDARAMSIDDIVAWGQAQGDSGTIIRHKLAWLSYKGLAIYDTAGTAWRIA
jgi:hypothetical protein